ncbi:hypothetical protein DQ04_03021010 [Trypanosoma grayi]|uniref:hypothetical protein n=1 Tax=Trypanosoma grayi TaxID=71804 RepID=UPI0004F45180|nr:hypothetical protein DQ04_03021010 [Trypanosoma grayi]KEG11054.1 hypothetical protein DQ04_03021010 [Trypanosoma grayi]
MKSIILREAVLSTLVWTAGDFMAQFYVAHRDPAKRRVAGEKRAGEKLSPQQMLALLDMPRLGQAAAFGLLFSPLVAGYHKFIARAVGMTLRNMKASVAALTVQQFFLTPLALLAYYNAITAVRGGFADPSFLRAYEKDTRAKRHYDAMSVEWRILLDVMPLPFLASWAVFAPLTLHAYFSVYRSPAVLRALFLPPWAAYVSYTQSTQLL